MNYDCSKCPVTLESFCDKEPPLYDLGLPFRQGDYVYATDRQIVVRVLAKRYNGPLAKGGRYPSLGDLGWDKEVAKWEFVPEPLPCEDCNSRRTIPGQDKDGDPDENIQVPCLKCRVQIQDTSLAWHLIEPLTRFSTRLEVGVTEDPESAVHFRFDGGCALVGPVKVEN